MQYESVSTNPCEKIKVEQGSQLFREPTKEEIKSSLLESLKRRKEKARQQSSASVKKNTWVHPETSIPFYRLGSLMNRINELENIIGDKPHDWQKPNYGNVDYSIAHHLGWISNEEESRDRQAYEIRRERSLASCHRYSHKTLCLPDNPALTIGNRFTPQTSAAVLNDNHLTDGAKVLALKLMEQTYRENREGRWLKVTVSYLMDALGRCRRTIQNYLRLLEHFGYIKVDVIKGQTSKMCIGLAIWLQGPLFPEHHMEKWPKKQPNPGVQKDSYNDQLKIYLEMIPLNSWALNCMKGIHRSFMRNKEPFVHPKIQI